MADEEKIVQDIELQGGQEVERQLDRIGEAGERAFGRVSGAADQGARSTGEAASSLNNLGKQSTSLQRVESAATDFGTSLRNVGDRAVEVGKQLPRMAAAAGQALGIVTGAMFALARAAANTTDAIRDASIAAGVSAQEFSRMGFAATQAGSNIQRLERAFAVINTGGTDLSDTLKQQADQLDDARRSAGDAVQGYNKLHREQAQLTTQFVRGGVALGTYLQQQSGLRDQFRQVTAQVDDADRAQRRIQEQISRTNSATVTGTQVFQRYGIQVKNADGSARDASEVMKDFADVIARIPDPAQRAALAAQAFGRRVGPGLVELLSEGRAGIEKLGKEADRLGLTFSNAELAIGDKFNDSLSKVGNVVTALATRIGLTFGPSFTELMDSVSEAVVRLTPAVLSVAKVFNDVFGPSVKFIIDLLGPAGLGIGTFGVAIVVLTAGIRILMTVLAPLAGIVRGAFAPFLILGTGLLAVGRLLGSVFLSLVSGLRLVGIVGAAAMGGILGPITLVAAAVGVLIIAFGGASTSGKSFGDTMKDVFKSIKGFIDPIVEAVGGILTDVFKGLVLFVTSIVIPAFQGLMSLARELASAINSTFGTNVTGAQVMGAAIVALAIAFGGLPAAIVAVTLAVGFLIAKFNDNKLLMIGLATAVAALIIIFGSIPLVIALIVIAIGVVVAKWNDLKAVGASVVGALRQAWEDFSNWFASTWVGKVIGAIRDAIKWFNDLGKSAKNAQRETAAATTGGAGAEGLARGGEVHGRGTSTSDSILARLSRGEFVIRADAVRRYGTAFMHAINQMRAPAGAIRGFNMGGLVDAIGSSMAIPRFALGGSVQAAGTTGRAVVLNIGGETFNLVARETDTANRLGRYATKRRVASTGRKPSYYGAGR